MISVRLAGAALASVLAATLIAGCAAAGTPAPLPSASSVSAVSSVPAAVTPAATPTPQGPPLTVKQAGRLFAHILGPLERAIGAFQADINDQPPFSQFKADGRTLIEAVRVSGRKLATANWPTEVQPDITTMMTTFEPAEIACAQAQINAGSYAAALNADQSNLQCGEANQDESVNQIRTILNIPA